MLLNFSPQLLKNVFLIQPMPKTSSWVADYHKVQGQIGGSFPLLMANIIIRLSANDCWLLAIGYQPSLVVKLQCL